jgi:C-terminal processing protease CtpA/Prc
LINEETCSAAENFILQMKINHFDLFVFGSPSAGSTGSPLVFEIPGGVARVCTKANFDENGKPFRKIGVIPDSTIYPSINDYLKDSDPVYDAAYNYFNRIN